jgi:hypothetical protein
MEQKQKDHGNKTSLQKNKASVKEQIESEQGRKL